jgi:hypothetical protein
VLTHVTTKNRNISLTCIAKRFEMNNFRGVENSVQNQVRRCRKNILYSLAKLIMFVTECHRYEGAKFENTLRIYLTVSLR